MFRNLIDFSHPTDLIEENYRGQNPIQIPIYIEIDWENETVDVKSRNYAIGGTPQREWNGIVSTFLLPNNVDAKELKDAIEQYYIPLIERLGEGFETAWNGQNYVGRFENTNLFERLEEMFMNNDHIPTHEGGLWSPRDYFEYGYPEEITAKTTDEELYKIADTTVKEALNTNNIVIEGNLTAVFKMFLTRRDELKEEDESKPCEGCNASQRYKIYERVWLGDGKAKWVPIGTRCRTCGKIHT